MAHLNSQITIVGGGLAGLSLACALRLRGVEVTVQEAGSYPRHRVCGEFISGVTEETLKNLGILDLFTDARRHQSLAWHDQGRLIHRTEFPEAAYGISRYRLDERIRQKLESLGGKIETGIRARPGPRDGLVWAAGRRPCNGSWIGLKAHVRGIPMTADLEMHMGSNGYTGLAEVEDGWVNICGLFQLNRTAKAKPTDLLASYIEAGGNSRLAQQLKTASWREDSFSAVAGFQLGRQPKIHNLLCVGDSESMIPPFTGNGMSMAFQAAEAATGPLVAWAEGAITWADATAQVDLRLEKKFHRRLGVAQAMHHLILTKAGRRLFHAAAATRVLPFKPLLSLIR